MKNVLTFTLLIVLVCSLMLIMPSATGESSGLTDGKITSGYTVQKLSDGSVIITADEDNIPNKNIYDTPAEILEGPTEGLLEYFESTTVATMFMYSSSFDHTPDCTSFYSAHSAFAELITRSDLLKVLDKRAAALLSSSQKSKDDETATTVLKNILNHKDVQAIIASDAKFLSEYPNINKIMSDGESRT